MDLRDYLWLVPALPLAGFLILVLLWPWADALCRRLPAGRGFWQWIGRGRRQDGVCRCTPGARHDAAAVAAGG